MTTYGYTRVSTLDQAQDRSSLEDQARVIDGVCAQRGTLCARIWSDPGVSGGMPLADRPAGGQLVAALRSGDTVIVSKLDRMFRSARDALTIADQFRERGVSLIIAEFGPGSVTDNGVSRMFFTMAAAFAEFERGRIGERVMDGKRGKRLKGGHIGGAAPYGMRVEGAGRTATLVPDPAEQQVLAHARRQAEHGASLRSISSSLAEGGMFSRSGMPFSPQQIKRMLT